jgi:hypothetical protein
LRLYPARKITRSTYLCLQLDVVKGNLGCLSGAGARAQQTAGGGTKQRDITKLARTQADVCKAAPGGLSKAMCAWDARTQLGPVAAAGMAGTVSHVQATHVQAVCHRWILPGHRHQNDVCELLWLMEQCAQGRDNCCSDKLLDRDEARLPVPPLAIPSRHY